MSRMKDILIDIQDMIASGYTEDEIAKSLGVPLEWVQDSIYEFDMNDSGDMDGDHASALASAGWGTDEDYGYYGDE